VITPSNEINSIYNDRNYKTLIFLLRIQQKSRLTKTILSCNSHCTKTIFYIGFSVGCSQYRNIQYCSKICVYITATLGWIPQAFCSNEM